MTQQEVQHHVFDALNEVLYAEKGGIYDLTIELSSFSLDSLDVNDLGHELEQRFGVYLDLGDLTSSGKLVTIADLVTLVSQSLPKEADHARDHDPSLRSPRPHRP